MPRLVPIKCPTCGAGLHVASGQEVVQCSYCHTSCFVRRPGAAPPMIPPGTRTRTAVVDVPRPGLAPRPIFALVVLILGSLAVTTLAFLRWRSVRTDDDAQEAPTTTSEPFWRDPQDVLTKAVALASKSHPKALLTGATFRDLANGRVDVAKDGMVLISFEYRPAGSTPGKRLAVTNEGGRLRLSEVPTGPSKLTSGDAAHYPIPTPRCSAAEALATATLNGIPPSATSDLMLSVVGERPAWLVLPDGLDRKIILHAHTCKPLFEDGDAPDPPATTPAPRPRPVALPKPRPAPPTQPPPRPRPKPTPKPACNCAPDDLMCSMKCQSK